MKSGIFHVDEAETPAPGPLGEQRATLTASVANVSRFQGAWSEQTAVRQEGQAGERQPGAPGHVVVHAPGRVARAALCTPGRVARAALCTRRGVLLEVARGQLASTPRGVRWRWPRGPTRRRKLGFGFGKW